VSRIFISYRREDSGGWAGRLYDRLSQHFGRDNVFMDINTIEPGLDFVDVIEQAVSSCDALVALIGRQWLTITDDFGRRRLDNSEDFVRLEITAALARNIRAIPVLVQDAPMPRSADLPDDLKRLSRRNALEISDTRFHSDVDRLITVLDSVLSGATPQARQRVSPPLRQLAEEQTHTTDSHGQAKEHTTNLPHRPSILSRLRHMIQLWERFHISRPSAMSVRIGLALTVLLVVGGLSIWLIPELEQAGNPPSPAPKDPELQYELGNRYFYGTGVDRDYTEALKWFRKAAAQGHAGAQTNLGVMYANGQGVDQDDAQAVQWYRRAALQGNAQAQKALQRRALSW
jgi:TIR domain/Sel1 repeat